MMSDLTRQKLKLPRIDSKNDDERISAILIPDQPYEAEDDEYVELPEATKEMLTRYHTFLLDKLVAGLKMTGREELGYFSWEERFAWGGGDAKEHEAIKQKYASCEDTFEFIRLTDWNEELGLMAEVRRITDQKMFIIPLVDLEVCKRKTREHQLVDDYSCWFVNCGPEAM
jgi:hypothetical protein